MNIIASRARRRRLRPFGSQIAAIAVTLFGLLVLTFFIGRVMPVDPVARLVGPDADNETYMAMYQKLGLDQPLPVQFWNYMSQIMTGDFGVALLTGHRVAEDIARVFPATIELATFSIILGAGVGIPLGAIAAANRGKAIDHVIRVFTLIGHSAPIFWIGLMGLLVFYAKLHWVGGTGRIDFFYEGMIPVHTGFILIDSLIEGETDVFQSAVSHIILPASVLAYSSMAYLSRMTRSFMLEQLSQEYVITAQTKGLSQSGVLKHAFRNIRVQLVTIVALTYGSLLEGAVLIETVFAWPGFGQYLTNNLLLGDMNAVMVCVLLVGVIFVSLNAISDLLYRVFDPRIR